MTKPKISLIDGVSWFFGVSTLAGLLGSSAYAVLG